MTEMHDPHFETLLEFLQRERGFDFTGYKRPSLARRVARRMEAVGVDDYERYVEYLEVHPEEFVQLFNTVLINVTSFFRDAPAWEYLKTDVVPELLGSKGAHGQVRIWSAGCASGEEAYSLAMLFAEALGAEGFCERVKVYGTDADEEALNHARLASYTAKDLETVDPALAKRYFEEANGRLVFRPDLRRSVIFGRHDIVQDAPISRLDLLVCRNTLMYFNAEAQQKILQRFHFALSGEGKGYLFLGRAEMLLGHSALFFTPVNLKCRIFAKVPQPGLAARPRLPAQVAENSNGGDIMRNDRLRELAQDESPVARIVVDLNGTLAILNQEARIAFSVNPKDIGRPLQDLEISYRPLELRSLIEQAYAERRTVTRTNIERRFPDGERQYFDVVIAPLFENSQNPVGVGITFVDVTRYSRMSEELQRTREEFHTANEELQSSNEELETTNQELQSSNEELETTNEELQSTNEELETMNEELQSTNEELQTVNEELRTRTEETNHLNAFLESVLTGMRAAAVVVNQNLNVLVWNRRAEDLWGMRADEVQGRSLLNLDIGLPVVQLRDVVRACLSGEKEHQEIVLDAVNRRGKKIQCRITCTPLVSLAKKREGAILLMEEIAP
ncbi:MAG TPA: CheR family methyltransferase [Burkholderiales bacterium]|nr:CheR family methyltransferase [Burkholderiales bacterium]